MVKIMVKNTKSVARKLLAWLTITRVGNCLALGYASIIGYLLSRPEVLNPTIMVRLFVAASTIGGSSNIINDYYDAPIDAINKPWRPIPAGLIKPRTAYVVSMLLACIGVAISFSITYLNGFIALIAFILSYLYSFKLKRTLLVGNIVVAFLAALAIVYGGLTTSKLEIHVILATLFAFMLNLGREFIKGIEDIEGDKVYGVTTLATALGIKAAYVSSFAVFCTLMALSIIPYIVLGYSLYYLVIALFGVDIILAVSLIKVSSLKPRDALKASRILKIAVFLGITAFLIEALRYYLSF